MQRSLASADGTMSQPKTERGRRSIALDSATITTLREHRSRQAAEKLSLGAAYGDAGLVFCREDGSHWDPDFISKLFNRRRTACGLPGYDFTTFAIPTRPSRCRRESIPKWCPNASDTPTSRSL